MDRPTILLTRPEPEARALAEALEAEGWRTLVWPTLSIRPRGAAPSLEGAQAALFTSPRAARLARPAAVPALCVGAATADAARAAGFSDVRSADGDAAALAALAAAVLRPDGGPLAFLRGAEVAGDLAGALRAAGFAVVEHVVYAAEPARSAPADVDAALRDGGVDVAAFYAPRAAAAFAALAAPWRSGLGRTTAVAISAAAAAPLDGAGFARRLTAARPDGAAMRQAIASARPCGATRGAAAPCGGLGGRDAKD